MAEMLAQFVGPDTLLGPGALTASGAFAESGVWNRPEVWAAELPAANGITDARSLARMYAATIGSVDGRDPLLTPAQVAAATERQTEGNDKVLFFETGFGLGFMVSRRSRPSAGRPASATTARAARSGFGDPDNGIAIGYVMNKMQQNLAGDPRTLGLITTSYEAIGASRNDLILYPGGVTPTEEAARRRTFAIISHPDAGKTTLTEKFLLYGGAVQLAGSVQGPPRRPGRHVRLDGARAAARHLDHVDRAPVPVPRTACSTCSTRPATATSPRTRTGCSPRPTPRSWSSTRPRASSPRRSSCSRSAATGASRC